VARFPAGAATEPDDDEIEQAEQLWSSSDPAPPRVAIVGRPNVGKSTLFNHLVGEDRSVVHDMAGTTRDAIDTLVETPDGPIVFVDTAGMRKRGKIDDSAEYYSMVRALRAIDDADIALLVIDAREGVTGQDQRLAERVDASGCPIVIMLNKWDLVDDPEKRLEVQSEVRRKLNFLGDAPDAEDLGAQRQGRAQAAPELQEAITQYHRRVPDRGRQQGDLGGAAAQPGARAARR
jgi:GTP-binding protein